MKRTNVLKKMIAIVLTFALLLTTMGQPVLAASNTQNTGYTQNIDEQAIQLAKDVYKKLTPEAKVLFEKEMEKDSQLLEFHKKNVNKNYVKSADDKSTKSEVASTANSLSVLSTELVKLNLPTAVRYTLMAMGGGLVAAGVDGPLPVGDLIAAVIAIGGIAVLAYYWSDISPKWGGIVNAFEKAFSTVKSKIDAIFIGISISVDQCINKPYTTISTDKIKIKTITITRDKSQYPSYFFAIRNPKGGITPIMPIDYNTAKAIMQLGLNKAYQEGVYCKNGSGYAKILASNVSSPGYEHYRQIIPSYEAPHWHPGSSYTSKWGTHAWYALK